MKHKYKTKNTKQQREGKNKRITPQLSGADRSFNDKVLDDERDKNSDNGENHEEEESALLVRQAPSGSARLCDGSGP